MKRDRRPERSPTPSEEEPSHSSGDSLVPIPLAATDRDFLSPSKLSSYPRDSPSLTRYRSKVSTKGDKTFDPKGAKSSTHTFISQDHSGEENDLMDETKPDDEYCGDDAEFIEGEERNHEDSKCDLVDSVGDEAMYANIIEVYARFEARVLKTFAGAGFYGPTAPFALGLSGAMCDRRFQRPSAWPATREAVQQLLQPFLPPNTTRPGFVQVITILLDHPEWDFPARWVRRPVEFEINASLAYRWLFLAKPSLEKNLRKNRFRRMGAPFHNVQLIWPTDAAAAEYDPASLARVTDLIEPHTSKDLALIARVQRCLQAAGISPQKAAKNDTEKPADASSDDPSRPDDLTITEDEICGLSRSFQFIVSRIRRYRFPSAKKRKSNTHVVSFNKDNASILTPQPLPTYSSTHQHELKPKKKHKTTPKLHPLEELVISSPSGPIGTKQHAVHSQDMPIVPSSDLQLLLEIASEMGSKGPPAVPIRCPVPRKPEIGRACAPLPAEKREPYSIIYHPLLTIRDSSRKS